MAAVKRSPKRTANCDLAMDHSRGGMIHSFSDRFKTRKRSLVAASSVGKWPLAPDTGQIELEVPRDREARFDPQLIAKYQRRFPGFDDKIISMYARGMSTREIVGHLRELYGVAVSPDLVSAVTDAVLDEIAAWQTRPLEPVYPLVFFDALRV